MNGQLALFEPGHRLADASLEKRVAAARQIIINEPGLSLDDRLELLLIAVSPGLGGRP